MRRPKRLSGKPWTDPADTRKRDANGWRLYRNAETSAHWEEAQRNKRMLYAAYLEAHRINKLLSNSRRESKLARANAKRARKAQRRLGNA